jgi:hypothetical protein
VPRGRRRRTPKWHTSSHTHAPSECRVSLPDSHPHLTDSLRLTHWMVSCSLLWLVGIPTRQLETHDASCTTCIDTAAGNAPSVAHTAASRAKAHAAVTRGGRGSPLDRSGAPACTLPPPPPGPPRGGGGGPPAPTFVASRPTHPTHDLFAVMFDRLSKLDLGSAHRHTNRDVLWVGEEHPHVCVRRVCASQLRASW